MIDIDSDDFAILPPHFLSTNPLDDDDVLEAMQLMYPKIIEMYTATENDPTGVLLGVLASVIYHSDWIISIANQSGGYPFSCILLLNHPELLLCLKEKVTIEKSEGISRATGIPPHIEQMKLQRELLNLCQLTLERVDGLLENFVEKINTVFEE